MHTHNVIYWQKVILILISISILIITITVITKTIIIDIHKCLRLKILRTKSIIIITIIKKLSKSQYLNNNLKITIIIIKIKRLSFQLYHNRQIKTLIIIITTNPYKNYQ